MRLSRLYSSRPDILPTITFRTGVGEPGLNVIMGEVKRPRDHSKDSHNLGKTTLIHLIDFLLLKDVSDGRHFLVKHADKFQGLSFYLEIMRNTEGFVTVRRDVDSPTRVWLRLHNERFMSFVGDDEASWNHSNISLAQGASLLDAYLNLEAIAPWSYRKGVTYFLRTQQDYLDYFQIGKFSRGRDADWKPYLAHVFGFDATRVSAKYQLENELEQKRLEIDRIRAETQLTENDYTKLRRHINIRIDESRKTEELLDKFSFAKEESRISRDLVCQVEEQIAEYNNRLYNVEHDIEQLEASLKSAPRFKLADIEKIFQESNIYFPDQLRHSYQELLDFNRRLSRDRKAAIKQRLETLKSDSVQIRAELDHLDSRRVEYLAIVRDADTFKKFKLLQKQFAEQRAELKVLENQMARLVKMMQLKRVEQSIETQIEGIVSDLASDTQEGNPTYEAIGRHFNELVSRVLGLYGLFFVRLNQVGNLDFVIETWRSDFSGEVTSQSEGTSYKKLLCALFDLAVLYAYLDMPFYHFVYHDGILEGLDSRKRLALINVIREHSAPGGVQYILTVIEDDLPQIEGNRVPFDPDEICLRLNDSGANGRLFKMPEF